MIACATGSCRCRGKDATTDRPAPAAGGYADFIGELREAGIQSESTCEEPPWSKEDLKEYRELNAKMAAKYPDTTGVSGLTLEALARRDPDTFVSEVESRVSDRAAAVGTRALSPAERAIHFYGELEGEVNNGGFHQYFSNSSGNCALQTLAALRTIDAQELAALFERALAVFPSSRPAEDRRTRNEQMSRIPNEFEAWSTHDEAFYKMTGNDARAATYLRAHLAELNLPAR